MGLMFRYATREVSQQLYCIYLVFHLMLLMIIIMILIMMITIVFTLFANHYIPIEWPVNLIHTFNDNNNIKVSINDNKRA